MYKNKVILFAMLICMAFSGNVYGADKLKTDPSFYVSLAGSDTNDGSMETPFKTIEKAKETVKNLNKNMTGDISVFIREGMYQLENTLCFDETDSGSNGYYVKYQAYNHEKVTLCGGEKIDGFLPFDDKIWVTSCENLDIVRSMYVNNRRAVRATNEVSYEVDGLYENKEDKSFDYDGIFMKNAKFKDYKNKQDIQLHFGLSWLNALHNVDDILPDAQGEGCIFLMKQPSFDARCKYGLPVTKGIKFYLENAFEELNTAGEFYFDRREKKLYYMPRSDEDMRTADVKIPSVEGLIYLNGSSANHRVKNLSFEGLTIQYSAWKRPAYVGLEILQANQLFGDYGAEYDKYSITPAAISLNWAEKIKFKENVIRGMDSAGIGLYQGVRYCDFVGNVFEDLADSAITVGLPEQSADSPTLEFANLAASKSTAASGSGAGFMPDLAVDDNNGTGWSCEGPTPAWWQVDLKKPYQIDKIELVPREGYDQPTTRSNFEILVSNDPLFKEFSIFASQGATPFDMEKTAEYYGKDRDKYRYVRIRKTDGEYFWLSEVRVINESMPFVPTKETCSFNKIQNNYITRVGMENWSAPGIQAYYVNTLNISHNEVYETAYSGICVGWGWGVNLNSTVCRNNSINYNRIHKYALKCYDAGGIYTLGQQPNTVERGNYISDQFNHLAGLYSDNGTKHYTITENVVENVGLATFVNSGSEDILHKNNYSPNEYSFGGENCMSEAPIRYIPGNPPAEVLKIMENAGLEETYKDIKKKSTDSLWNLSHEQIFGNAIGESYSGSNLSVSSMAIYYIHPFLTAAEQYLSMAVVGDGLGMYSQESIDRMHRFIETARKNLKDPYLDGAKIADIRAEYELEYEIFKNARNTLPMPEMIAKAKEILHTATIGTELGNSSEENYQTLCTSIKKAEAAQQDDMLAKLILERSITDFEDKKITLKINSFNVENQITKTNIDHENGTIDLMVRYTTDRSKLKPKIDYNPLVTITPSDNKTLDFTKPVTYTLSTKDQKTQKTYTAYVSLPEKIDSEQPYSLVKELNDEAGWGMFGATENKYYNNSLFGDITLDFTMNIENISGQWAGIIIRSQDPQKTFEQQNNDAYIIVLAPGIVELHRFNSGKRTQFYGDVPDVKTYGGSSIKTDAFQFGVNNHIQVSAVNRDDGVDIALTINGKEIFEVFDNYEGKILNPGYFGTASSKPNIILSAE